MKSAVKYSELTEIYRIKETGAENVEVDDAPRPDIDDTCSWI